MIFGVTLAFVAYTDKLANDFGRPTLFHSEGLYFKDQMQLT